MSKTISSSSVLESFEHESELDEDFQLLVSKAREVCENAYAPYSQFKVGAALLLKSGAIVTGSNQENSSYNSGLCAERVAFFAAGAQHPADKILKAVVLAQKEGGPVNEASPCGSCRQVMLEYEFNQGQPIEILFNWQGSMVKSNSVANLLPFNFNRHSLK